MERATTPKRWTVSSEAGKAAGVPLALFVALAANAWRVTNPNDLDKRIYEGIGANGHGAVFHSARIISSSASPVGGTILVVLAVAYMWRKRHDVVPAVALAFASGSAALLQWIAKQVIQRPRPQLTAPLTGQFGFAFPSGHAAGISALVTLLSLLILAKRLPVRRPSLAVLALASFGVLVAFTRLLVGAHYFTDAVAGLALGCAISCLVMALLPSMDRVYGRFARRLPEAMRPNNHPAIRGVGARAELGGDRDARRRRGPHDAGAQ